MNGLGAKHIGLASLADILGLSLGDDIGNVCVISTYTPPYVKNNKIEILGRGLYRSLRDLCRPRLCICVPLLSG